MEREDKRNILILKEKILILHKKCTNYMKKVIYYAGICLLFLTSCKKSQPVVNGSSSYFSFSAGSTWNYSTTDNSNGQINTYTLTATANDSIVNGRTYHVFNNTSSSGTTNEYYNITGNEYYQYSEVIPQQPAVEQKYLIDNVNAGTSWTTPFFTQFDAQGTTVSITGTIKNTIEEKGTSLTVNGINYIGVIKVKTELQNVSITVPFIGNLTPTIVQSNYSYYAPKYGMVKNDLLLNVTVDVPTVGPQEVINTNSTTTLSSANIL